MDSRSRVLTVRLRSILLLVAILAALASLSLFTDSVSNAQTEIGSPVPGGGGDPGGPAAPVLTATPGYSWISVSWEPVAGADMYEVLWRWETGGNWQRAEGSPIANTAYGFLSLSAGTGLYFLVRAIDADGRVSNWSELAHAAATGKLAAPTLTATISGANAVELSWTSVGAAVRYEVWAWWNSETGWQPLDDGNLKGLSYPHTELTAGRTYYYLLAAVDSSGNRGEWSEQVSVTVPDSSMKLAAPTLQAQSTGANAVALLWNAVSGATRYELWVWRDSATGWQQLDDDSLTGTSFTHREVAAGTTYYYAIRSVDDSGGASDYSQLEHTVSATVSGTQTPTPTPTPTLLLSATPSPTPTPTLLLSATPTPTPTPTLLLSATPTSTPTLTPLLSATPTRTPTPTVSALTAPVLNATASGTNAVDLSWTSVPNAARYVLWTWWDSVIGWQQLDNGNLTVTSHTHNGLSPGTTYVYAVRAIDANNQPLGPWSNFPQVTLSAQSAPVLTAAPAGATAINLSWTSVTGAARYELWTKWDSAIGWQQLDDGSLSGTSRTHSGLTPGTTYQYAVRALGANDQPLGPWSNFPQVTLPESPVPSANEERAALAALYNATDGANWRNNDYWLTDTPLSFWHGVKTDADGRVTSLILTVNRLSGTLPDLSALTNLTILQLYDNNLTGSIPDLSALTNLATLDLNNNQLTGSIPDLNTLTNMAAMHFFNNHLTGSFPDLSALTNLTSINFSDNQLEGNILSLSALSNLRYVYLRNNELSGEIPDLSALNRLVGLGLSGNQFSGEIPDLSGHPGLRNLSLSGNQLSGEIPDLSGLIGLNSLSLGRNQLSGGIPDLGALIRLQRLSLNDNQLDGEIPDLTALTDLTFLSIAGNDLCLPVGTDLSVLHKDVSDHLKSIGLLYCGNEMLPVAPTLPEEKAALFAFYHATGGANWSDKDNWLTDEPIATWYGVSTNNSGQVIGLSLPKNNLTGEIPDLSDLTELTGLNLSGNQLTGQIPVLSAFTKLTELNLGGNGLSGPIPALNALTELTSLSLSGNELSGQIPDLSALTQLTSLHLEINQLSGQIPPLQGLTNLTTLYLYRNQLSGKIPDLSTLTNLTTMRLETNQLIGPIPVMSALTDLAYVTLTNNKLTGNIAHLRAPASLQFLKLGGNKLTGKIPNLSGLSKLTTLELNDNQLDGPLPDLSLLTRLWWLDLSNNSLTGEIRDLKAPPSLVHLYLAANKLSGGIQALTASPGLMHVNLAANQLNGGIQALSVITHLTTLNLSDNQLTGDIQVLSALTGLTSVDLSANQLDGPVPDLSALTKLTTLDLTDNDLCLRDSLDLASLNSDVAAHLTSLSLPSCAVFEQRAALVALYEATNGANWTNKTNWLTEEPLSTWHGITTGGSGLVTELRLSANLLVGAVPDFSALTNLTRLDLNTNQLSGPIPALDVLTNLTILDLSSNHLTGELPPLSNLSNLTSLNLSSNQLTGEIPDSERPL